MNWFYGGRYWIFSGIASVGELAVVTSGWHTTWLWRILLTIAGMVFFIIIVGLGLQELGKMFGGDGDGQIRRGDNLCIMSNVATYPNITVRRTG